MISETTHSPEVVMLTRLLADLETAWLADKSTAPHDDAAAALLPGMTLSPAVATVILAERDPRFLRALLLRGVSRLWVDGPNSHPQKA